MFKTYLFVIAESNSVVEGVVHREVHDFGGYGLGTCGNHVLDGGRDVLHCWRTWRVPRVN